MAFGGRKHNVNTICLQGNFESVWKVQEREKSVVQYTVHRMRWFPFSYQSKSTLSCDHRRHSRIRTSIAWHHTEDAENYGDDRFNKSTTNRSSWYDMRLLSVFHSHLWWFLESSTTLTKASDQLGRWGARVCPRVLLWVGHNLTTSDFKKQLADRLQRHLHSVLRIAPHERYLNFFFLW